MHIVVIGGGYAGLAALLELRSRMPRASLTLVDPQPAHLKVTQLHHTLRKKRAAIAVDFAALAERHKFDHVRATAGGTKGFKPATLKRWQRDQAISVGKTKLAFDALVVATGSREIALPEGPGTVSLKELREKGGRAVTDRLQACQPDAPVQLTIVGGGATGIQFLFELGDLCRERRIDARLRLVNADRHLLPALSRRAHDYALRRMREAGYDYHGKTRYIGQRDNVVVVRGDGEKYDTELESSLTLLFPGVAAWPDNLRANRFGQALVDGKPLADVYLAGDCARYQGNGLDALTAQAAVRKGKHVAMNISRADRGWSLLGYDFRGLGYIVSMGPFDAVGWMLTENSVVTGLAAYALTEVVEKQYDLFVSGIDTYLL